MNRLLKPFLHKINKSDTPSMSMRLRLLFFLIVLVFTMLAGIIIILMITGTFTAGIKESKDIIRRELKISTQEISEQYGKTAVQAVDFSGELSKQLEEELGRQNLTFDELSGHPDKLEAIISESYDLTFYFLQRSSCSGAFFILNTTVNPKLANAINSRAGLYIKNMEPNVINSSAPELTILKGFSSIGRKNRVDLHTQWSMEFDVSDADYYSIPQKAALQNPDLVLSRLYYWNDPITIPGTSEEVMLCTVPLINSKHELYGVCGLEISAMLFKLANMPQNNVYSRMFCMLAPIENDMMDIKSSMFAGGYSLKTLSEKKSIMKVITSNKSFNTYVPQNGSICLGFHTLVQLYPSDSPFNDDLRVTAVLVPKDDIVNTVTRVNLLVVTCLSLLVAMGIFVSIVFSNKYLKPISEGIEIIKTTEPDEAPKTNVQEIDDLINYLSFYKKDLNQKIEQDKHQLVVLEQFVEKTKTLTPTERSVFNLYVKGLTAKEIAEQLFLSINTIKTHSKHIYAKLDVSTREELLLYINMLKEAGKEFQ